MTERRGAACHPFVILVAALFVAASPRAAAGRARDVTLAPAPTGHLGAWLVAGPLPPSLTTDRALSASPVHGDKLTRDTWAPRWRLVASGSEPLDLADTLPRRGRRGADRVALGGVLSLAEDFDGWILVGSTGDVALAVDGTERWARATGRSRAPSWDPIALKLPKGQHRLVIVAARPRSSWSFDLRLLERNTALPPSHAFLRLPGTDDTHRDRLMSAMSRPVIDLTIGRLEYRLRAGVDFPRGAPSRRAIDVTVELRTGTDPASTRRYNLGRAPVGPHGAHALIGTLPPLAASALGSRPYTVRIEVGGSAHEQQLMLTAPAAHAVAGARDLSDTLRRAEHPVVSDRATVLATLEDRVAELEELARAPNRAKLLGQRTAELEALVDEITDGQDPIQAHTGIVRLARRSRLDGQPDRLMLHVPAAYADDKKRRYPLVLLLHGYRSSPEEVMRAFLDSSSTEAHPRVDGFVVAPRAQGDAFYRGPGEAEALDALDWALRTFPIDASRVAVTGVSMGATGAAHLALRHADRFSAVATLAGYQSYFVRRDTAGQRTAGWERARMHHWSPASWAENAAHLTFHVARGRRDRPLEHSRVLSERLGDLGYRVTTEWPDTGHSVWTVTYDNARLWARLTAAKRPTRPDRVVLATDSLRYGSLFWVEITALSSYPVRARLEARVQSPRHVVVETDGVDAFELDRTTSPIAGKGRVVVEVDDTRLLVDDDVIALHREGSRFAVGPKATEKKAGVEGAVRDALLGPVLFVYGTRSKTSARVTREVAEHFARRYSPDTRYRVVADRDVRASDHREHSLFLVGSSEMNRVVTDLGERLPIVARGSEIRAGSESFGGPQVGALYAFPNPREPTRYVIVLTSPSVSGIWRALSLPQLLPDFVVYDARVGDAAGGQILGPSSVAAAGFFDGDWALPSLKASISGDASP